MMGNVIVWKPAETQMYSAHVIMKLFKEAGLPDGVINMVVADGPEAGEVVLIIPNLLVFTLRVQQLYLKTYGRL